MINRVLLGAFALFIFILPIPGTIALRHFLTLALLCLCVIAIRKESIGVALLAKRASPLLLTLAVITTWLLLQAGAISQETAWAMKEITNQWLPALLMAALGVGVASAWTKASWTRAQVLGLLASCMLAQVLASLLAVLPMYLADGYFPQAKTWFTAGKLEISYWNNLLLALLAVDALGRWLYRSAITNLPLPVVAIGILLVVVSNLAFGARAGVIGSGMLVVSLSLLVLWHERGRLGPRRVITFMLTALLLVISLAAINYRLDSRWATFTETAEVAWSQSGGQAWLNPEETPVPALISGVPAEESAYYRISWIRAGIDLVADYPLGVGYGRNAFGHALRKTSETRLGHAHSGIIDWTVGTGLPGLVLWLGLLGSMLVLGLRRYFRKQDAAGLVLVFAVGGFFGRMLIDSINRDHMLMLFFLILGILVALPEESAAS